MTVLLSCRKLKLRTEIDERVHVATIGVIMRYQTVLSHIRRCWVMLGNIRRFMGDIQGPRVGINLLFAWSDWSKNKYSSFIFTFKYSCGETGHADARGRRTLLNLFR